jgi:hypothetical protein
MSSEVFETLYYFHTDTFIAIIHDLELVQAQRRALNASISRTITKADLVRWETLFGLVRPDTRVVIAGARCTSRRQHYQTPTDETLQQWP